MAELLGYCRDCGFEICDIDEEYMINGEPAGLFECPICRTMHTKESIVGK